MINMRNGQHARDDRSLITAATAAAAAAAAVGDRRAHSAVIARGVSRHVGFVAAAVTY